MNVVGLLFAVTGESGLTYLISPLHLEQYLMAQLEIEPPDEPPPDEPPPDEPPAQHPWVLATFLSVAGLGMLAMSASNR